MASEPRAKGEPSGSEVLRPSPRQIAVARAYVEQLESEQRRLGLVEADLAHATWYAARLANYNRALYRTLTGLLSQMATGYVADEMIDGAEEVLRASKEIHEETFECLCGHSVFDHDDDGCQFLGCRPICG